MAFINWSDDISTGIESLDGERKKLLTLLNSFYDSVQMEKGETTISRLLDDLIAYTATLFSHEEEHMLATGYPSFHEHRDEHDRLRQQLMEFHTKAEEKLTHSLSQEILVFLKCWLLVHSVSCDRAYGPHLRAKGIT
ncbi:MAG: bacteriohemerythrin [Bdellovibrionales bacterium]